MIVEYVGMFQFKALCETRNKGKPNQFVEI